jgi:chromosome segregation ATPase
VFLALLAAAACDKPPTGQIEAAQAQVEAARSQGAGEYAADRLGEAEAALQKARAQMEAEDYRAAVSSAQQAGERARSAVQAMAAARTLARGRAQVAVAEVKAVLDEIDGVVQEAAAAKVAEDAFTAVAPQAQALRDSLAAIEATLDKEPLRAQTAAAELKTHASDLATAYRQAQATWMAEHRQGGRRRK